MAVDNHAARVEEIRARHSPDGASSFCAYCRAVGKPCELAMLLAAYDALREVHLSVCKENTWLKEHLHELKMTNPYQVMTDLELQLSDVREKRDQLETERQNRNVLLATFCGHDVRDPFIVLLNPVELVRVTIEKYKAKLAAALDRVQELEEKFGPGNDWSSTNRDQGIEKDA